MPNETERRRLNRMLLWFAGIGFVLTLVSNVVVVWLAIQEREAKQFRTETRLIACEAAARQGMRLKSCSGFDIQEK